MYNCGFILNMCNLILYCVVFIVECGDMDFLSKILLLICMNFGLLFG